MAAESSKRGEQKGESALVKTYLVAYNVSQMLGWLILFVIAVSQTVSGNVHGLYRAVEPILKIFQTAAFLEVLHCAVGFVKSNVTLTGFQVYSRVFLLWGVIHSFPATQNGHGVAALLFAWSITEIIRYGYYFFSLLGQVPYFLVWCRYTFFIVLYPIGVTGELMTIWTALPYAEKLKLYSFELPNTLNMSFSYYYYLWFIIFAYIPVFPQLYMHMLTQRKKILGRRPKTD
ncbi:very-long-chain (3R)-3-hydroxyacyl-CoA dehydratase 2-like [Haliotis rubra]|uniref:very-long-chain (3R)-3-hydroxyacyl-CoA dehydratase 2-like n=1 Tax=Haliotis rubra TaxID=36100 RepID=UPI001EE5F3F3|nr:very-long-chain (3R)-3-hydroxyacyl-CoA dehydratase 2-like [Haliotis rubra]